MSWFLFKRTLGKAAIKEGIDNLPSGICFADHNGTIILCNRQMHRLCHILMGSDLQHIFELRRGLASPQPGVNALDSAELLFRFPDGTMWQFSETTTVDKDGSAYTQMQAVDVTELHEKSADLEKENLALREANTRARKLYAALDQIVREKETLAMKMRVHDDMGLCLLATRKLLTHGGSLEGYKKAGEHWASALEIIGIADRSGDVERPMTADESLTELIASTEEIGVHVTVEGALPEAKSAAYLMIVAMRECVTNMVRHAQGSEMTVNLTQTQNADVMQITNNGKRPEGEISEGGGLSGLRRSIENRGGTMTVESKPVFRLTVTLPRKEEKRW